MVAGKRKKLMVYGGFSLVLLFAILHVTYFNQAYSPLQVLSDARSEARRLLKFLTLYHYQCNSTIQGTNMSNWPICLEKVGGLNLVLGGPRIMYSLGPTADYQMERILALNFSYNVLVLSHVSLPADFTSSSLKNKTRVIKTIIVPNDPADYGRNSYETQTLNNVFEMMGDSVIDILKMEALSDMSHAHEVMYFAVKDKLFANVRQLHFSIFIDKVDDDFLYSWYQALYMLFHEQGFRLYSSRASDYQCLQVTLMESCIYYLSWIRDPGPETFILYPPAIDGSADFEVDRILDYLDNTEVSCKNSLEVNMQLSEVMTLCMDKLDKNLGKPCQLVIIRSSDATNSIAAIPKSRCSVFTLELEAGGIGELIFYAKHGRYINSSAELVYLEDALQKYLPLSMTNLLFFNVKKHFWSALSEVLNSGSLYLVDQFILNLQDMWEDLSAVNIKRKYSELQRIEAYGFRKFKIDTNKVTFHGKAMENNTQYHLNYLKTSS